MKHIWKSKEKKEADVEEGLCENENVKREYVIQVVRETKHKWWCAVAIYVLVMVIFGLSFHILRTYSSSETMSVIYQRDLPMSELQSESQKSNPSNEALETSTESLTVSELNLLENKNDFSPETLVKLIPRSSSEMESDNTVRKVFDPLLVPELDDSVYQKLNKIPMEDLTSVYKLFSELENDLKENVFFPLLSNKMTDKEIHSLTKNDDNTMPNLNYLVLKSFSKFQTNLNKLFPLLNVDKMADADVHGLTKSDDIMPKDLTSEVKPFSVFENDSNEDELFPLNTMPADDVKDLKTVSSSEDPKVDETHDKKPSAESEVVNCPPDKSDESSTEVSSSESAQLEEKDDTDLPSSDYQMTSEFKWFSDPSSEYNVILPFTWYSEGKASRVAYIRDSLINIKQITSDIKLSFGSSCKIIIIEGVVDATLCPEFSESTEKLNLESSAPQTDIALSSTQTNTILPSIQTSTTVPPSTQTTSTTTTTTHITTEEDHNDYYYYDYYNTKHEFFPDIFTSREWGVQ
ncbi:uncharacterized protein LOC109859660 [Pseudomyrmex gracilis]|uniref:uncharacterized protein LOC109859660 n=1 Tax=Pseudomyrmex gracilis TaxID=219809 RepID=UPI000995915E|nr:uncharacterized protein LOC109859660 [Pseudomyrmex gracilis]